MLRDTLIRKDPATWPVQPWLGDLAAARADFSWEAVRSELLGAERQFLNIGQLALDRHPATRQALRIVGAEGQAHSVSYGELAASTNRLAHALRGLGLQQGDVLFVLCPRGEPLFTAVLGALKAGVVVAPLFTAFGPEPLATRLAIARPRALVTTRSLYRRRIEPMRARLDFLHHVIVIDDEQEPEALPAGTLAWSALLAQAPASPVTTRTRAQDPALIHFTSGTTGTPKAALHVHEAALMHWATARWALDLHPDGVFWCTADPGWVTGTSYGILAPLLHGVTSA